MLLYLIKTIIPRKIQDLFYFVGLDTNGAYWTFFDVAVEHLGFERYTNPGKSNFNQIKNYPESKIHEMILENISLQEIHDTTCATKPMIKSVIRNMKIKEFGKWEGSKGERLVKREVTFNDFQDLTKSDFSGRYDFVIYKNKMPSLVIEFDGEHILNL